LKFNDGDNDVGSDNDPLAEWKLLANDVFNQVDGLFDSISELPKKDQRAAWRHASNIIFENIGTVNTAIKKIKNDEWYAGPDMD